MNTSFHHLLMKCHLALQREVMAGAKGQGLTSGQPKILEYLSVQEGADQKTIAEHCEIESATVGSILTRMESAGLIERRRKGNNRRSLYVYLTDRGRAAAAAVADVFAGAEARALRGLEEGEVRALCAALQKVYANLEPSEAD